MTRTDFETAKQLLANIEALEDAKIRATQSINVDAQAQSMNEFIDVEAVQTDIIAAIDAKIAIDEAAFAAL
jgi:hypothetical protein